MDAPELPVELMKHPGRWPARAWCWFRGGHGWLMQGHEHREFVSMSDVCLTCGAKRELLPSGVCLCGHNFLAHAPRCDCGCSGWM